VILKLLQSLFFLKKKIFLLSVYNLISLFFPYFIFESAFHPNLVGIYNELGGGCIENLTKEQRERGERRGKERRKGERVRREKGKGESDRKRERKIIWVRGDGVREGDHNDAGEERGHVSEEGGVGEVYKDGSRCREVEKGR
jgi:hypothetical protein